MSCPNPTCSACKAMEFHNKIMSEDKVEDKIFMIKLLVSGLIAYLDDIEPGLATHLATELMNMSELNKDKAVCH